MNVARATAILDTVPQNRARAIDPNRKLDKASCPKFQARISANAPVKMRPPLRGSVADLAKSTIAMEQNIFAAMNSVGPAVRTSGLIS